jgi:tRNA nucleotidyltransferase (CCA-adding enzyme)
MIELPVHGFIREILERLSTAGHQAYIVGGAVRDAFLKRSVVDWDVTTSASPREIKRLFEEFRQFELKKGTVTLVRAGRHFEITPFKGEGRSLQDDLERRDFTINAIAYEPFSRKIVDPFGGERDLARRIVRGVQDPAARFKEDPVRLLRAVRFTTELSFTLDEKTHTSILTSAKDVTTVAPERIREELLKILLSFDPERGFRLMILTHLLQYVLPELLEVYHMGQEGGDHHTLFGHTLKTVAGVEATPVLRLAALFHDIAKPRVRQQVPGGWSFPKHEEVGAEMAEEIMLRLRFSHDTLGRVTNLVRNHRIELKWSEGEIRRLARRVGRENIHLLLALHRADLMASELHENELFLLSQFHGRIKEIMKTLVAGPADLAVDGREVMEILGIPPGPKVGQVLEELVEMVTETPALNRRERLRTVLQQMRDS